MTRKETMLTKMMNMRANVSKIMKKAKNDQDERYIKDEMNNSKMKIVKRLGRRRTIEFKRSLEKSKGK